MDEVTLKSPINVKPWFIGVVGRQALKCSASEALNAESYNTLQTCQSFKL